MESQINEKFATDEMKPASLTRIFFARLVDVIISCIPGVILGFFYHAHDWASAAILVTSSFALMFLYFILLAYWCRGNTIGKLMFGLRLIHLTGDKIGFREVLGREIYHVFIPWFFQLLTQIATVVVAQYLNPDGSIQTYVTVCIVLQNVGSLFYFVWFLYVGVTIKGQVDHQSAVDFRFKIYCVYHEYDKVAKEEDKPVENHVHLEQNMPGAFDVNEIDKILEGDNHDEK
jgi:uncharacterized RDD family membrane protein YckC